MIKPPFVSTSRAGIAIAMAASLGLSKEEIYSEANLTPDLLEDLDGYVSFETYQEIFSAVVRLTGDEFFWLRNIKIDVANLNNIIWYYAFNAPNVISAMERVNRHYMLVNNAFTIESFISENKFVVRVIEISPKANISDHLRDWALSQWWGSVLTFAGAETKLLQLRTKTTSERRIQSYREFFQAPVEGGHLFDDIVMDKATAFLPNVFTKTDPNLDLIFEKLISKQMEGMAGPKSFEQELMDAIQRELVHGTPPLSKVASRMGMGSRTLQRRLKALDLSYSAILAEHRHTLALSYLKQDQFNITEIAFMLGHKKISAFTDTFKTKQGMTPSEYRKLFNQ